jgi:hypothetical protein
MRSEIYPWRIAVDGELDEERMWGYTYGPKRQCRYVLYLTTLEFRLINNNLSLLKRLADSTVKREYKYRCQIHEILPFPDPKSHPDPTLYRQYPPSASRYMLQFTGPVSPRHEYG